MRIISDLDHTLADHEYDQRINPDVPLDVYREAIRSASLKEEIKDYLDLADEVYIITSRSEDLEKETKEWLERVGITYDELYMIPYPADYMMSHPEKLERIEWKKSVIESLEPDVYIDDSDGINLIKDEIRDPDITYLKII